MACDYVIEYSADKSEFRLNDDEGSTTGVYDVPSDGCTLVSFEGDPEDPQDEDIVLLVTTYNYAGEDFEPDTVYDVDATETEVREGVDLSEEPEVKGVDDDEGE